MAYRFKLREGLARGVRRIGLEQIERVEAKLKAENDVATAVHDARRSLKRLRALLRLVRPALEHAVYREESQRLAQVGRMLSGARDRFVMGQTLAKIENATGTLPKNCGARISGIISDGYDLAAPPEPAMRREALAKLGASRRFFSGRALRGVSMTEVWLGLEKSYRKGRGAFGDCYRKPSDEAVHAWRKAVQQHWRHMALLQRAWPGSVTARVSEAKALSQILGEDHDLAVLAAFVSQHRDKLPDDGVAALLHHVRARQKKLRMLAKLRGDRLFHERPEDLVARISGYWDAAKSLQKIAGPESLKKSQRAQSARKAPKAKAADVKDAGGAQSTKPLAIAGDAPVTSIVERPARKRASA
jgi:CHAD domain-containing protein